jgi:molybdate transport system substrate-binding protein
MNASPPRRAHVNYYFLAFLASALVLAALVAALAWDTIRWPDGTKKQPILVYCAAGVKPPVAAAALDYERVYGVSVRLQYDNSQTLLAGIEISRRGDLYLPGDDTFIKTAREKNLVDEALDLADMKPVLAVKYGNPLGLRNLADLTGKGARLAHANPDAAAVGKLSREALRRSGAWDAFSKQIIVYKPTVSDVANDIRVGAVDAGVIWDAMLQQYPDLEAVPVPELADTSAHLAVGVLRCTEQPAEALRFARFLAAPDWGLEHFAREGYAPIDGDKWAETPELQVFAGAMLRPAIEQTITRFEEREGVRVTRVYNGCGILVSQMRAADKKPDAYFACDQSFMSQVKDLFDNPVAVSTNQLVILVHKGNPHHIQSLKDLGKPGLRVGVGHEKQCALGMLTQTTLVQGGEHDTVMKNVKVQSPTGDLLVNQLRAGSLDAVIAYVSNATEAADELDAIPIDVPCAVATQPIAVAKNTAYRHLAQRLLDAVRSQESRERFESNGFHWQAPPR